MPHFKKFFRNRWNFAEILARSTARMVRIQSDDWIFLCHILVPTESVFGNDSNVKSVDKEKRSEPFRK